MTSRLHSLTSHGTALCAALTLVVVAGIVATFVAPLVAASEAEATEHGAVGLIDKPFHSKDLIEAVERSLAA